MIAYDNEMTIEDILSFFQEVICKNRLEIITVHIIIRELIARKRSLQKAKAEQALIYRLDSC